MASSVNNIAAAFSTPRLAVNPSPAITSSPAFSSTAARSGGLAISVSWNPHSSLPRSHRSSLLSVYGPPGQRPTSSFLRSPAPLGLPCSTLSYLEDNTVRTTSSAELGRGRKIVILGVPAAFAPRRWFTGKLNAEELVKRAGEMKKRGASVVACVSVNDVFVMRAWGERIGAFNAWNGSDGVMMLSDPEAGMAREMGLAADFSGGVEGFGLRSETYCVVAADGIVKAFFREENGVGFDHVIRAI